MYISSNEITQSKSIELLNSIKSHLTINENLDVNKYNLIIKTK